MYGIFFHYWILESIANVAHGPNSSNEHVCINGIVYWFCQSRLDERLVGSILAVDWEENLSIIRIPEEETMKPFLANLEGCLCMVVVAKVGGNFQDIFDIWVLEDSKESAWVKKLSDHISFSTSDPILCVVGRVNEVFFLTRKQYSLYNIHTTISKVFNWACGPYWSASLPILYQESLFPCKY